MAACAIRADRVSIIVGFTVGLHQTAFALISQNTEGVKVFTLSTGTAQLRFDGVFILDQTHEAGVIAFLVLHILGD